MTIRREKTTWTRVYYAKKIIAALGAAAKTGNGEYAYALPGPREMRPSIARMLREMGVPLMARRAGHSTVWFILSLHAKGIQKTLGEEWRRRIIGDAYAEVCRAHMAVAPHPHLAAEETVLATCAVMLGAHLGYGLTEVSADIAPTPMDPDIAAAITAAK